MVACLALIVWHSRRMWALGRRAKDARNALFVAALEFGENWRRDVAELAAERLPTPDSH